VEETPVPERVSALRAALRAGLFALIAVAGVAALAGIGLLAIRLSGRHIHVARDAAIPPQFALLAELVQLGPILLATWVMTRYEHRPVADFGLPLRRIFAWPFAGGIAAGLASIALVVGAMIASGSAHVTGFATTGGAAVLYALLWAVTFLVVGMAEESFFRGYPQFRLGAAFGYWPAAVGLSVLFALLHRNPGETPLGQIEVFLFGMFQCFALRRFGDLRWPIGFHAAWDWGQTCLFGVGDSGVVGAGAVLHTSVSGPSLLSGGSTGPEATIFTPVILAAVALLVSLRVRKPATPATVNR
jgi:membrane protease YdiL (CAAX protease family)